MLNTYFFKLFYLYILYYKWHFQHYPEVSFIKYIGSLGILFAFYLNEGDRFVSTITKHRLLSSLTHSNNFVILVKVSINSLTTTLQASVHALNASAACFRFRNVLG